MAGAARNALNKAKNLAGGGGGGPSPILGTLAKMAALVGGGSYLVYSSL